MKTPKIINLSITALQEGFFNMRERVQYVAAIAY
jgi:hypothetical protein